MPWHVRPLPSGPIIEAVFLGVVTAAEIRDGMEAAAALGETAGSPRILADCTRIEEAPSVGELYFLAGELVAHEVVHRIKSAFVIATATRVAEAMRFWETTCNNWAIPAKTFTDRASALAWLLQP
ncbi:MAG TPA: hypothetical protein VMT45_06475 [Thermoanaerobaculaceae bacterium]|nr:hypothetical protein [Thermoanaerobaculaceae bacterium]